MELDRSIMPLHPFYKMGIPLLWAKLPIVQGIIPLYKKLYILSGMLNKTKQACCLLPTHLCICFEADPQKIGNYSISETLFKEPD